MAVTNVLPTSIPTAISQNVVYALPSCRCWVVAEPACEVGQSTSGPWTAMVAAPAGQETAATFIRCTTGFATVTAKKF